MKRLILVALLSFGVGFTSPLSCDNELVKQRFSELYDDIFKENNNYFVEMKNIKEIAYDKRKNLRACAAQFVAYIDTYSGSTPYETLAFYYDIANNNLIMKLRKDYEITIE